MLGWPGIFRLGLVQAMLGAVVVLTTSTLNRVMVVELALPALLPGLLVALHYAVQLTRPRMGYGSDQGQRRTPWIIGGMAVLALGGFGGAVATAWMGTDHASGVVLATMSFALVGLGVSAAGTSLLVLLAKRVAAPQRAAAATTVWVMMIVGFAVTAGLAGTWLDPYSPQRLMAVSATVSIVAFCVAMLALRGLEGHAPRELAPVPATRTNFRAALAQVAAVAHARSRHLHGIVQCHQQARQQRRQGQLDDHHAVQRRGGQHHHRAQHGLHQAQPEDARPAQHVQPSRSAKALTIMPATNSGTPKPL